MNKNQKYKGKTANSDRILYTASPFARKNLFYLQETGSLQATAPHTSQRTYLNSFLFLFVNSGSGIVHYQGNQYELKTGDCAFINCMNPYSHSTNSDLWSLNWIHFNGTTVPNIYQKFLERSGRIQFHAKEEAYYYNFFKRISDSAKSESYVRDMEINEEISSLLTVAMRDCWNEDIKYHKASFSNRMEALREYLSLHFTEKITLEDLSKRFFISKYYLIHLFKNEYGITIYDYIFDLRINYAKELLRFSSSSIEEISEKCGFYDLPYFSRQFKKAEGISPSAYRDNWK